MVDVTTFARVLRPSGERSAWTIARYVCIEQWTSVTFRIVTQPSGRSTTLTVISEVVSTSVEHGQVVKLPMQLAVAFVNGTKHAIVDVHKTGLLGGIVHRGLQEL